MLFDLADFQQRCAYIGVYEAADAKLVSEWLKPGMHVIDVGANFGYYTLLAASRVGQTGRVYSFEPHPNWYASLCDRVHDNGLDFVEVHNLALSDQSAQLGLYVEQIANNATLCESLDGGPIIVEARTLDSIFHDLPQIDLLKIDIEGW